jgi:hypothetical protein
MRLLHGVSAPTGNGTVLEVHLDIQNLTPLFRGWLEDVGFENDPFLVFYPPQYTIHMTGRTRVPSKDIPALMPEANNLTARVIAEAQSRNISLYTEVELARETLYLSKSNSTQENIVLDECGFRPSGEFGGAKADVHVEFLAGTVPPRVRKYLSAKLFYWVMTPLTSRFPSEEIATLQTSTFHEAKTVYDLLVANPLRNCTGLHLEQKLSMKATSRDLPMPEVIEVTYFPREDIRF